MASRLNDEVILSKIILSHFCPKQANEWIGGFVFWIIKLFIAILTWTNLTCSKKPYSQFFHPPFLLFIFWKLKNGYKKEWGPIIELFIACLAWPNLMCFIRLLGLLFQHLTPPVGGPLQIFERSVFERTTYRAKSLRHIPKGPNSNKKLPLVSLAPGVSIKVIHIPVPRYFPVEIEMYSVLESCWWPTAKAWNPPRSWFPRVDFPTPVGPRSRILGCGSSARSEHWQVLDCSSTSSCVSSPLVWFCRVLLRRVESLIFWLWNKQIITTLKAA